MRRDNMKKCLNWKCEYYDNSKNSHCEQHADIENCECRFVKQFPQVTQEIEEEKPKNADLLKMSEEIIFNREIREGCGSIELNTEKLVNCIKEIIKRLPG
jgi:hypothetical protein